MKIGKIYNQLIVENKNSIIAYHGSTNKITSFMDDFVGGRQATDQEGPGIYFTTSLNDAMMYGENIHKVELMIKKSVSTIDNRNASLKEIEWLILKAPDWEDTAMNWSENPRVGYKIAATDFIKYNNNPHQQFMQVWYDFYRNNPTDYVRNMSKLGYDSIIIGGKSRTESNEFDIKHIIVLNPNIIKIIE